MMVDSGSRHVLGLARRALAELDVDGVIDRVLRAARERQPSWQYLASRPLVCLRGDVTGAVAGPGATVDVNPEGGDALKLERELRERALARDAELVVSTETARPWERLLCSTGSDGRFLAAFKQFADPAAPATEVVLLSAPGPDKRSALEALLIADGGRR